MKSDKPLIYLITSGDLTPQNYSAKSAKFLNIIETAVKSGVSMIQIREKNLPVRLLFQLTSEAVKIGKDSNTKILVNDRADVAIAAHADGVHLTSTSISAKIIRQSLPQNFIIGVSTHKLEEVIRAKTDGANFAVFSPVFKTPTKEKYGAPQGVEKLREVVQTVKDFPIIALGGINEENFVEVFRAGASGIAAIRFLNDVKKMSQTVRKIREYVREND